MVIVIMIFAIPVAIYMWYWIITNQSLAEFLINHFWDFMMIHLFLT